MSFVTELLVTEQRSAIERWVREHAYGVPMPGGDTLCRVLGEYMCVVTLDDHSVAPHLVMNGYWQMWVTMCLAKRVKPGWRSIDVGANFGYYTLLLADLVGPAGKVEAWEPSQDLRTRLAQTIDLSGMGGRISICDSAASNVSGEARLARRTHDYGGARVRPEYESGAAHLKQELIRTELLASTLLDRIDFVKIDAEGMEPEVWAGLGDRLPQAALIEWCSRRSRRLPYKYADAAGFLTLLRAQGYSVGVVNPHGDVDEASDDAPLLAVTDWLALFIERTA